MKPWWMRFVPRNAAGDGGDEGGGGGSGGAGAAGAGGAGGQGGAGGAQAGGGGGQSGAQGDAGQGGDGKGTDGGQGAGSGDGGKGAGAAGQGDGKGDSKGYWPEDWRDRVSKGDDKLLARFSRYGSPEAALQALVAAQNRISSGELRPTLGKNASAEEIKEWREAHGIPEDPAKYDLGKDVKIDDADRPVFDVMLKAMHGAHATPEVVRATVQSFNDMRRQMGEAQVTADRKAAQEGEDALRSEWGNDFRRNINLIHGLLDGGGSQELKGQLLGGRLADGTPIGSSPEALKMLLGLALINNPTGVVVEGGSGVTGEGIREELQKLQKMPAGKKTDAQSERERSLIDAAIKANLMNDDGSWKK